MSREAGARRVAVASAFAVAVALCLGYLAMWVNLGALVAREPGASIAGGYYLLLGMPVGVVVALLALALWQTGARRLSISVLLLVAFSLVAIFSSLAARTGAWLFS